MTSFHEHECPNCGDVYTCPIVTHCRAAYEKLCPECAYATAANKTERKP